MSAWPTVSLGKVLSEERRRIGTANGENLPLLGVSNAEGLHRSGLTRISDMSRYFRVEQNWFAYNPMRINVGSVGWAKGEDQTGIISPDYVVFSCTEKVLPELIYWFLKHRRGLQAINAETAGSVRERLYFGSLARIEFPLPPLAEQRRLVKRIDTLAAKIEEAKRLRAEADFESGILSFTPFRLIPLPKAHEPGSIIGEYLESHNSGWSPQCDEFPATNDDWGVLKTTCVQWHGFQSIQNKALLAGMKPRPDIVVRVGDVLITRAGPVNRVGVACTVQKDEPRLMLPDKIVRMRTKVTLDPNYLAAHFATPFAQEYLRQGKTGLAESQVNISREKLLKLPIVVPPIDQQKRLLLNINAIRERAKDLQDQQKLILPELDALFPAILDRAFRGEL